MSFVQVPPDAAGKQIAAKEAQDGRYVQVVHLADKDNPEKLQKISEDGSQWVEFSSGTPTFSSFNRLQVAEDEVLGVYKFYEPNFTDIATHSVSTTTTGSASANLDNTIGGLRLRTEGGPGNKSVAESDKHFGYKPACGHVLYFVVSMDDSGSSNVIRRFGNYDEDNGLFLEVDGTGVSVVLRDSRAGTDTKVHQSQWNGDRLDGSDSQYNQSKATLDITKLNIFFVTYQYLSAGAVTFGTYIGGSPTVLHTFDNYGNLSAPYMENTYLPLRAEIENIGASVGTTDLYLHCFAAVKDGYKQDITRPITISSNPTTINSTDFIPVVSIRPSETIASFTNRFSYFLEKLSAISTSAPIEIGIFEATTLVGDTWSTSSLGIDIDNTATSFSGGRNLYTILLNGGESKETLITEHHSFSSTQGVLRKANPAEYTSITVSIRCLLPATSTDVVISGIVKEVQ